MRASGSLAAMKALIRNFEQRLKGLPPAVITVLGLAYVFAIGIADYVTPQQLSFTLFYACGIGFVAWGTSKGPAMFLAVVSAAAMALNDWDLNLSGQQHWLFVWNAITRLIVLGGASWLIAETARLTRNLGMLVDERTAQWRVETERHKATALNLSQVVERFEQVINNITEVFWLRDVSKDQMTYVSPSYERVWGRACDELYRQSQSWLTALHPEDRAIIAQRSTTEQTSGNYEAEYRIVRPDGSIRWIRDRAFPVRNPQGAVCRIAGISEDITQRKQAEASLRKANESLEASVRERTAELRATNEALKESEQKYRQLYESMIDAFVIVGMNGQLTEFNPAYQAMLGYTAEELRQRTNIDLTPEKWHAMEARTVTEQLLPKGYSEVYEKEYRRKDGTIFPVELRTFLIRNALDQPAGMWAIVRDITERKQAENALREARDLLESRVKERTVELESANAALHESEERYRSLVNNLNVGVYRNTPGPEGKFLQANLALARIHGCDSVEEFMKVKAADLYQNPGDRELYIEELLRKGTLLNYEVRLKKKDGTVIDGSLNVTAHRGPNGEVDWIDGVLEDITERKRAEETLHQSEERYRSLFEHSAAAIWEEDFFAVKAYFDLLREKGIADWRAHFDQHPEAVRHCASLIKVLAVNRAGMNLLQVSQPEEVPLCVADFCTEESWSGLKEEFIALAEGRTQFEGESTGRDALGEQKYFAFNVSVEPNSAETLSRVMVSILDITERKQAEIHMRIQRDLGVSLSSTSNLKLALDQLLDLAVPVAGVDSGGIYLLNPIGGGMDLVTHRGVSAQFVKAVSHWGPDSPQMRLVLQKRPLFAPYCELPLPRDEARLQEGLRATALVPLCHEGNVIGALGLSSHVVDEIPFRDRLFIEALAVQAAGAIARIRAEEALCQSEARLRAIIAGAPVLLFAVDRNGVIVFGEGQALKAMGTRPSSTAGKRVREVYADFPAVIQNAQRALRGEEFNSVVEIGDVTLDCWYSPTLDEEGKPAGYIGVATNITERHRLEQQLLEIADREQARIGQDIHDGLCQHLVSLAFDANSLEQRLSSRHLPEAETAHRITYFLDEAITESRQLSRGLFPVRLESEGLPPALEELAKAIGKRFKVQCRFQSTGLAVVKNSTIATHLYRIAQEAVANAIKHGHATTISIHLHTKAREVELRIEDDGTGFSSEQQAKSTGIGLHIMDYRARNIGGILEVRPGQRKGTVVSCCVPGLPR